MAVGPVLFAGRLGQDAIGEAFVSLFAERGVDTARLQRDSERPSWVVLVRRSSEGERQFQAWLEMQETVEMYVLLKRIDAMESFLCFGRLFAKLADLSKDRVN